MEPPEPQNPYGQTLAEGTALRRCAVSVVFGVALAVAFPPYKGAILAWVALAVFLNASLGGGLRVALLCGFLHGLAFFGVSLPWVYGVMREHGGLNTSAAAAVYLLMVVFLALFHAAFAGTVEWIGGRNVVRGRLSAPFVWVALEFARTHMPVLGFPWNLLGYAASQNPGLVQVTAITGIYGLSFIVMAVNAFWSWSTKRYPGFRRAVLVLLLLLLVPFLGAYLGSGLMPSAPANATAYLVQTNFPQAPEYPANWMELHAGEMDELERISLDAARQDSASPTKGELIIWPEVPAPFYFLDPKFAARAERVAREANAHFLVGVVEWRPGPNDGLEPYNSAVLLDPAGKRVFQYDKIHLVPFGEYVPLRRVLKFAESLVAEVGDYRAGSTFAVGQLRGGKFGVFICYEAIFPDEVRRFVANGAELLINISNDGWYGRSAAPEQHLAMARVRAVENRRWLLRATNNGYTVAIDPYGREVARLRTDVRSVLPAPFGFRSDRTIYSRWGDWFAWLCVVGALVFLIMRVGMPVSMDKGSQEVRR